MLRLALLSVSLVSLAAGQGLLGRPDCPCIDPWNLPGGGAPEALTFVDQATGRGCLRGQAGNCFPLDYGTKRCFAWDVNLAPRCADQEGRPLTNAPEFCKQPWCFVESSSCRVHNKRTGLFPGYNLAYSYETCGAVDFFSAELLASTLNGKTLRAGVPATSVGKLEDNGHDTPTGWSAEFVNYLLGTVGATVQIEDISLESRSLYPQSTYSACARDVALGLKDFCYGAFWETPDRLIATAFTPIYETELFYLVVPSSDKDDAGVMLGKIFAPFSVGLWFLFIFLALVVGWAMWLFGEVGNLPVVSGVLMGLHMAGLKFMGHGGGWDSANTRSGNVLLFGFSFLCMLGLASYTANLSSYLLMANLHTGVSSLQGAIDQGIKICTLQSSVEMFSASYPKVGPYLVKFDNWGPMVDGYMTDKCGAMLLPPETFEYMRAAAEPFHNYGKTAFCHMRKVGEVLLAIPTAIPINRDLDNALSYVWSRERFAGKIEHFKLLYPLPSSECPATEGLREGATPLRVGDLLGGIIIIAVILAISFALYVTGHGRQPVFVESDLSPAQNAILGALADLETALRNQGLPVGVQRRDHFMDALAKAKENPKLALGGACLMFFLFLVACIVALIAKLNAS